MRKLLAMTLSATLVAGPASAQFITDDGAFGSDSLVTDTISGMTWLNLDATMGLSLSTVRTDLESDPLYADFRFATSREIIGLFGDAGFCVGDVTCNAITDPSRLAAEASFAGAFRDDGSGEYLGYINDRSYAIQPVEDGLYGTFRTFVSYDPTSPYVGRAHYDFTGPEGHQALANTGTWLVSKSAVGPIPEPSTYALMVVGLGAFVFIARRRRDTFAWSRLTSDRPAPFPASAVPKDRPDGTPPAGVPARASIWTDLP